MADIELKEISKDEWLRFLDSAEWLVLCAALSEKKKSFFERLRDSKQDFHETQYVRGYLDAIDALPEIVKNRVAKADSDETMKRFTKENGYA